MSKDEICSCKACKNTVFHCQICKFVGFLLPSSSWLLKLPIIEIQRNRFPRLVTHVSGIVEERRNVVRWRNTPAVPRNQRRGSQVTIFLQIWTFLENLYLRQTIYHYQCLGQVYAYCTCIRILQQEWGSRWSPLLLQSFTRSASFLRFPSQHFNCCFNWSTVCSSGSLSSLEPGMTSSSVRTV